MNKKKLLNILLVCGIFLWIIPSAYFSEVDRRIVLFFFGFHIIIALLYGIYLFNFIRDTVSTKFEWVLLYLSAVGDILVHIGTFVVLLTLGQESNIKLVPWILILRGIIVVAVIIYRYSTFEESEFDKKIRKQMEEEKIKKSQEIEDKTNTKLKNKIYNKWLFKILFKDFKSNFNNYLVFVISAVLTVTYVYGFIGNLFIVHGMEQTSIAYIGEGITRFVLNALVVITIVNILIQFYALKNYIKNRMYDFKTLMLLGMKKKDIYRSMGILLGASLLISYFIGAILGNVIILIFTKTYNYYLPNIIIPKINILNVIILSFIICVIVLGFILAIVQDLAIETSMMNNSSSDMEEKLIKPRKIIFILPVFLLILMMFYCDPHWAESKYIIYPMIIIFVVFLYFSGGYVLRRIKSKNKYYFNNIFTYNLMFYKSKSYFKNSILLFTLLFIMFFTYAFQIATLFPLEASELYPYDYVCLGFENGKKELEEIEKEFDVESEIYPAVRVTVPGGEEGGYGNLYKTLPIGHHLGISESTYKQLTGKKINLKDKEICIIYQEDKSNKAHPLDFYVTRSKPHIRIGKPQQYFFMERDTFFDINYDVVKEKREIVLGRLTNVMYENIVVFSDEHFNSQYKEADGVKYLMTINSNIKNDKNLESYLDKYSEAHEDEENIDSYVKSVYKGKDLNEAFQGEKIFKLIINISILITFIICSIIIIFVHVFGNISYYKKRYEILSYLGEKNKNSNNIIKKEVWLFAMAPCILALLTSVILIAITVKMRRFSYLEFILSAKVFILIILAFLLIYSLATFIISRFLIKNMGGK